MPPQLGVFSPFYISALGVYVGLSAGSFHPGTLELFTARRLQPFLGWGGWGSRGVERWRREGVGHWFLKSSRLTQAYWWCVCIVSDPTECMWVCYLCLESRACVSSLFGWLKPLVCPSGCMSAAGRVEFLSPSICTVGPQRSSCSSQLVKWVSPPEASTAHKARASNYFKR